MTSVVNSSQAKDAGIFFWLSSQCINMLGALVVLRILLLVMI